MSQPDTLDLQAKERRLFEIVADLGSALVAYSGGVDSTLLLRVCVDTLGPLQVLAVTATSETLATREELEARSLAAGMGARHLELPVSELQDEEFVSNPPDRCYHCKRIRYGQLARLAHERGLRWVVDGANADDLGDYRPGLRAASELGVRSPLQEAGLSKADVRRLSHAFGLPTWDKPSFACLASRIPYGNRITAEKLRQIDASEGFLQSLGFQQVRVRHHGDTARIEVSTDDIVALASREVAPLVVERLKALGFSYVSLDLEGYRTGSMNELLRSTLADKPF